MSCDHKFIDSRYCVKCGWAPDSRDARPLLRESRDRYKALVDALRQVIDEFEESPEPRSYSHAYDALAKLVRGFRP